MSPKRPKSRLKPPKGGGAQQPKSRLKPGPDSGEHRVTFSFQHADLRYEGEWGWPTPEEALELFGFLADIGRSTWNEVRAMQTGGKHRHRKHHEHPLSSVCPTAQQRLAELHLDEVFEELFRFRLGGENRLWGFVVDGVFYVLWWDPDHNVYPTEKN